MPTPIRDLFVSDVTRDIPPVVYFHEQSPEKLADEVGEYIITGGWPAGHPNHRRVPDGIHEQYVGLLRGIASELDKPGGPELPTAWISGFYGSGKSCFAKLLGLALDGVELPDGRSLAAALLARDTSPRKQELRDAWKALRQKVDPIAVVFDIGSVARDNEHIHAAAVRQVQRRLGYCRTEPLVADFELKLERDGEWSRFQAKAREVLDKPWEHVKDKALAEEDFSLVLSELYPDRYPDPMAWFTSRAGTHSRSESPEEAVAAICDMLRFRAAGATLFLVVDEVSQYVLSHKDRVDRLRAFASALGAALKGKTWLVALGQQRLDEQADDSFLIWAKDRFPPRLRVHLAATNIRDVVHKRLLQKKPKRQAELRELFQANRANLKLHAHGCDAVTPEEFVEVYPLLPGHIDLLLRITSALRTRSSRAQGDDQAIRGLLQLLGELFRDQELAEEPVGALVTLDRIYAVQHTALDSDVQHSMARILDKRKDDESDLPLRAAKAVALLELIQDTVPTDAKLVARCLYDRVDRGNQVAAVTEALEGLRRDNLLGYSEKHGYKIQSSAGEEWERERREKPVPRERIGETVQDSLKYLLAAPERPRLQGRPFPWAGVFSDGRSHEDAKLMDPRDDAVVRVDFRFLPKEERTESAWVKRSDESTLRDRLLWVCGDAEEVENQCRNLARSRAMVRKYKPRRDSLNPARKMLLQQEEIEAEDLEVRVRGEVAAAFMAGRLYFRGRVVVPRDQGAVFGAVLSSLGARILPDLFPHFVGTSIAPGELLQLVETDLSGPSPKFLPGELGILELDAGRYVPSCSGVVPRRVLEHIEAEGGLGGTTLLAWFGGTPYGYPANVVKACVAGLLRAGRLRVQPDGGAEITAVRDAGVRELFDKDRAFRRADLFPAGEDDIGFQARARICHFFHGSLDHRMDREDHAIADAVSKLFPSQARQLREVLTRLDRLPGRLQPPEALLTLQDVLEACVAKSRHTRPTVQLVKRHLDALRDGIELSKLYDAELTPAAIQAVRHAANVQEHQLAQLEGQGTLEPEVAEAGERVAAQLGTERPWREIAGIDPDLERIVQAYVVERGRLLRWQEARAEQARAKVKAREGFCTLSADNSHKVLRPVALAQTETSAEAVAPILEALKDPFLLRLRRAERQANRILDGLLSDKSLIVTVDLGLEGRELRSEEDVEALVNEVRERLLEKVRGGARVRLV